MQKSLQILNTSWLLRHTLLLCLGTMMSFSLSGQITCTPRLSYTLNKYRVNCSTFDDCNIRSKAFGIGLHNNYRFYKELSFVVDFNFYTSDMTYSTSSSDYNFNYLDFKIGLLNNIFSEKSTFGIGFQLEKLYDIQRVKGGVLTEFQSENQYGVEFSISHTIGKVEFFGELYYNLGFKDGRKHNVLTLRQNNIQFGLGIPISINY